MFTSPKHPLQADLAGIDIPIMIGTTNDEANLFLGFASEDDIAEMTDGAAILQNVDYKTQEAIFSSYDGYPSKSAAEEILTDLMYKVPASRYADCYSAGAPVYFYRYDAYPFPVGLLGLKAFHACDLLMLCGTIPTEKAGHQFMQYIGNFVKSEDPNGEGIPEWKVYSSAERNMMVIDKTPAAALNLYGDKLAKYDGIEYLLVKQPQ